MDESDEDLKKAIELSQLPCYHNPSQSSSSSSSTSSSSSSSSSSPPFSEGLLGEPIRMEMAEITQYDSSVENGKSACTFISSLTALRFLNGLPLEWTLTIRQAAKLYNQLNVEKMSRGLGHSAGHSTLEESFQFIFSSSSLSSSASSSPSSSSLSSSANSPFYFNKMPQIKSLGDDLFGVLLRRSPPKEIPPEPVSRAPLILELAQFFTDEFMADTISQFLKMNNNDIEATLHFLLENREVALQQQQEHERIKKEEHFTKERMRQLYDPFHRMQQYRRPSINAQVIELDRDEQEIYNSLKSRIEREKELLGVHACGYRVVNGKKGMGEFITSEMERLKMKREKYCLVFTSQMQTTCLCVLEDQTCLFRDSHRNEQMDFISIESFFKWLVESEMFSAMSDADADGFLDFGMIHFNKVDIYLITLHS
eukprot:CAMPEP_0201484812 /NCGR_PEP_ID=MMETSP0151_2-20130828/8968_1 /ASSEMBLY_ACC=CAM_ASM_000257 /TAXON_ID=200890 /ORGANISM="Paramoeba atlantica, Strain 621/1 / CCAP 1560/9" /LENGTH=424 /DNA_ID=CAMNT_0047868647 /DNA_START=60 /DNA_END=1334 /DNA_ORIENTATION=+